MSSEKYTVADEAADVVRDVTNRMFMPEATYSQERAPLLCSQIVDATISRLAQNTKLPRKYIAHCAIIQKNGAGIHAVSACQWDPKSDGCYVFKAENKAMICILTVYGVTM